MPSTPDISTLNAAELQKLIASAQAQIQSRRQSELTSLTDAYIHKIAEAGFCIRDAQTELKKFEAARNKNTPPARTMQARYGGPNGERWSGQGQNPKWMRDLIAQGRATSKDDFLLQR